jgi:lysophospholipase L1-like esterase
VVLYGDSITEQNLYTQWVELYAATRFPAIRIQFFGAGVGGDRVTGGGGGTVDERLARDVFSHKPTVITVMLGMNDGSYQPNSPENESKYTTGFEHLLRSIRTNAPGARITLLGPSPYDDVTRPAKFSGGYNAVMQHFANLDQELARKFDCSFIDLNPPVVALLNKAQALDPEVAKLLLPDRVHPDIVPHWVMAETLLKAWNAPAIVSSVTIDARSLKAVDVQNVSVDSVESDQESLHWTETEGALPLPLIPDNATYSLLLQLTEIEQQLNQEILRVAGLEEGQYNLTVDADQIGTFSADELATGINLADYPTPMRRQAEHVGWMVRDRDQVHLTQMHMLIGKADTGARYGKPDLLDEFQDTMEKRIYETAVPRSHVFKLSRIDTSTESSDEPAAQANFGKSMAQSRFD